MSGLIVSDPARCDTQRERLSALLHSLDLPLTAFTEEPAALFSPALQRPAFLRTASAALLQPGQPLPIDDLLTHLSSPDPLPANVLRRYLFLQLSLTPYLRPGRRITLLTGSFLLGDELLVVPVTPEDTVDVQLPPGIWTELTGSVHEGRLRCMRGYNEMPVLARENALLPISINGQSLTQTAQEDTDRLTLHWFQPQESAACTLADGTCYQVQRLDGEIRLQTDSMRPVHLILHENGRETLIR